MGERGDRIGGRGAGMSMSIIQLLRRQGAPFPGAAEEGVPSQDEGGNMGGLPAVPGAPEGEQDILQIDQGGLDSPTSRRKKKLARRAEMPEL